MPNKKIIMKVWKRKTPPQKLVTVPKDCEIEEGDYVEIKKIEIGKHNGK